MLPFMKDPLFNVSFSKEVKTESWYCQGHLTKGDFYRGVPLQPTYPNSRVGCELDWLPLFTLSAKVGLIFH